MGQPEKDEHEVDLLSFAAKLHGDEWGHRYFVRWRGHTSADDEWLRAEELGHGGTARQCPVKVAEYDAAALRRRAIRRGDSGPAAVPVPAARAGARVAVPPPAGPAQLVSPARSRVALATEVRQGKALVGHLVLYCWPAEGWARGRVVGVSRAAGLSHVVGYGPTSALGAAAVA